MRANVLLIILLMLSLGLQAESWDQQFCSSASCLQLGYDSARAAQSLPPTAEQLCAQTPCPARAPAISQAWVESSYKARLPEESVWTHRAGQIIRTAVSQTVVAHVCQQGQCLLQLSPSLPRSSPVQAQTGLALMNALGASLDLHQLSVFAGQRRDCTDVGTWVGSNKCCSGGQGALQSFWGQSCSASAQAIIQARNMHRASYLGRWQQCTQTLPWGGCLRRLTHYAFCLWPSQIAEIVQEQGRRQWGQSIPWDCRGFTLQPDELARIDFNLINFQALKFPALQMP